jgi:hypothetical protein
VTNNSIDQENILIIILVCYIIIIFDKIIQSNYIYIFICISRFANYNKLVFSHIIIELRYYYPNTRYNNNKRNSMLVYRDILYYNNREIVFWNPCIYLLNPN